jgi:transcriptional regulator with XRE-family HTH domain
MPQTTVDVEALYAALDRKRQLEKLSWRALATKLGITPSTFTRMAQGLKPDVDTFATLIRWLGIPQEQVLQPAGKRHDESDPFAMISSYLRGSKNIRQEEAEALEDIISAAFRRLVRGRKNG